MFRRFALLCNWLLCSLVQELNVPFNVQRYHNLVPLEVSSEGSKPEQAQKHVAAQKRSQARSATTGQSRAESPAPGQAKTGSTVLKQTSSVRQAQSCATNSGPDIMDLYP